jgi:L-ascorbate metabolism protein UlaG (beta-lactamase superfamily)
VTRVVASALLVVLAACAPPPPPRPGAYHGSDADLGITRIAHGGVVIEFAGRRFLVDPWLHAGLVVRHREPLGLSPATLPSASAVLVTHGHGTHFDPRALGELAPAVPRAVGPPPLAARLRALGFGEVVALDWWADTTIDGVRVTAVPARHAVRENGYVLQHGDVVVYAAGDTETTPAFADVAHRFGRLDVALLPIGGWRRLGDRQEMDPDEAAAAARILGARRVIPIGYGASGLFPFVTTARAPAARFRAAAEAAGLRPEQIVVLEPGESWHYFAAPR